MKTSLPDLLYSYYPKSYHPPSVQSAINRHTSVIGGIDRFHPFLPLICEPILSAISGTLHKSVHNKVSSNSHIISINRLENFINFLLTVFFSILKLFGYFSKNNNLFLWAKKILVQEVEYWKKVSTMCCFSSSVIR